MKSFHEKKLKFLWFQDLTFYEYGYIRKKISQDRKVPLLFYFNVLHYMQRYFSKCLKRQSEKQETANRAIHNVLQNHRPSQIIFQDIGL